MITTYIEKTVCEVLKSVSVDLPLKRTHTHTYPASYVPHAMFVCTYTNFDLYWGRGCFIPFRYSLLIVIFHNTNYKSRVIAIGILQTENGDPDVSSWSIFSCAGNLCQQINYMGIESMGGVFEVLFIVVAKI